MIPANLARFVVLAVIGAAGAAHARPELGHHAPVVHARPAFGNHAPVVHAQPAFGRDPWAAHARPLRPHDLGARPLRAHDVGARPLPFPAAPVTGRIIVMDKGNKAAPDVGQAVVWLEPVRGNPPAPKPVHVVVTAENKTFTPHVAVVPVGSTVTFPNRDGFDHNVFSLSDPGPFDLGLYERGDGKSATFPKPGLIRVYCNIHSTMSAFIVVTDTPWYAQPAADGSYSLSGVPAGEYVIHAWHERAAAEDTLSIKVTAAGAQVPDITLDARGFRAQDHLNKYGKPYARTGRRY